MAKYESLGEFLRGQKTQSIRLTFAEVERIVGHKLPRSSRYPAWWSNNPSNNVMTKVWLAAGFKTEQVDIPGRKLVFRKTGSAQANQESTRSGMSEVAHSYVPPEGAQTEMTTNCTHPAYGSMKGLITFMPGVDLTEPADPEWGERLARGEGRPFNFDHK